MRKPRALQMARIRRANLRLPPSPRKRSTRPGASTGKIPSHAVPLATPMAASQTMNDFPALSSAPSIPVISRRPDGPEKEPRRWGGIDLGEQVPEALEPEGRRANQSRIRRLTGEQWKAGRRSEGLREDTLNMYGDVIAGWLVPNIGGLKVLELSPKGAGELVAKPLRAGLSSRPWPAVGPLRAASDYGAEGRYALGTGAGARWP